MLLSEQNFSLQRGYMLGAPAAFWQNFAVMVLRVRPPQKSRGRESLNFSPSQAVFHQVGDNFLYTIPQELASLCRLTDSWTISASQTPAVLTVHSCYSIASMLNERILDEFMFVSFLFKLSFFFSFYWYYMSSHRNYMSHVKKNCCLFRNVFGFGKHRSI